MKSVIIVDKNSTINEKQFVDIKESDLYKKCGFRKIDGFTQHVKWSINYKKNKYDIAVYARESGKPGYENKYDLPPPIDNKLYYGSLAIVKLEDDNTIGSLTEELWLRLYEKLFGGFDDLSTTADDDDNESDELESISNEHKTKLGYLKDGFVVEDESNNNSNESTNTSDDENNIIIDTNELDYEDYEDMNDSYESDYSDNNNDLSDSE